MNCKTSHAITAIATVVVAVAAVVGAVFVNFFLFMSEEKRASVERTLGLYEIFAESDQVSYLRELIYKTEWERYETNRTMGDIFFEMNQEEKEKTIQSLQHVIQELYMIYDCAEFDKLFPEGKFHMEQTIEKYIDVHTCDRNAVRDLFGRDFMEMYFGYKILLYCHPLFEKYYYNGGDLGSYVAKWENLVIYTFNESGTNSNHEMYRTKEDRAGTEVETVDSKIFVGLRELTNCDAINFQTVNFEMID